MNAYDFDLLVIGSGPAGQKSAIQAAKAGRRVGLVESDRRLGGACVYRGTIPSKSLRESALRILHLRRHQALLGYELKPGQEMAALISNLQAVTLAHDGFIRAQLERNGVHCLHGRASFVAPDRVQVEGLRGEKTVHGAAQVIIASGSLPRRAEAVPVDHEHILDSDSVLSMLYLPESMVVLGGGIIACEYASVFASLGVKVAMIDRYPRPLGFIDGEIVERFLHGFACAGGEFIGSAQVEAVRWDGVSRVLTRLADGRELACDKLLSAAGRVANVGGLNLAAAGLELTATGHIAVNASCQTAVPTIYAVGDVIGPPALASASMEQGRRASAHALGIDLGALGAMIPMGIYAIPEISSVGMDEAAAAKTGVEVLVGRAKFEEIARGQISGIQDGLLKLVADRDGKLLGAQIVGEGATELIHIAQMGLLGGFRAEDFVENIFNFPTLAEAYRVAALQITAQLPP
ncbi:MAG: Si-specific NAD(P)(+) transhydrogenase [Pseudomonadales bacterium]|nr:Si-specific NAD(P)(+) transhydrogenase [Pseudomonadales bacterium]MBP7909668.1 Si-specific NAD(P)(+) transhydrogenase [Pseudomonadales bacterium]